jgi:hypothetical protein
VGAGRKKGKGREEEWVRVSESEREGGHTLHPVYNVLNIFLGVIQILKDMLRV